MVRANARPDEATWVLMLAGHVKAGSADRALGAFKSLRTVGCEPLQRRACVRLLVVA